MAGGFCCFLPQTAIFFCTSLTSSCPCPSLDFRWLYHTSSDIAASSQGQLCAITRRGEGGGELFDGGLLTYKQEVHVDSPGLANIGLVSS